MAYFIIHNYLIMKSILFSYKTTLGIFLFTFFTFNLNCKTVAQPIEGTNNRTLSINMSAVELIPADLIVFNININAEAKTPKEAFDMHRQRETLLAGLLKRFDIEEENIRFQPVRMNKRTNYDNRNNRVEIVQTNQQVSVSFSDFSLYEKIQITLIENGFDSFNGNFSSSKTEEGKEKALASAIKNAKERARFISEQSGVKLGEILTIGYSEYQINQPVVSGYENKMLFDSPESMMDFAQTVSITANISINFLIK